MAGKMGTYSYISDDGATYKIREDVSNAAATGASATTGRVNLPHGYIPRHVWAVDSTDTTGGRTPTNARRKVVISDPADTQWTGASTAVTLPDFSVIPSVSVAWVIQAYVGEKRFNR
jgi:hypothetical protein